MTEQEGGTITRTRKFAQLPDDLIRDRRLSSHAVRVWACLDRYAGRDGRAFPSRSAVAEELGLSLDIVKRAMAELVETGWITRQKRPGSNVWDTHLSDTTRCTSAPASGATRCTCAPGTVHQCTGHGALVRRLSRRRTNEGEPTNDLPAADAAGVELVLIDVEPAAPTQGQIVQVLVGAYAEAVKESGGVPTESMRKAIGAHCKRLLDVDHIEPAVILRAVQVAGSKRAKDVDRHLGDAQLSYQRGGAVSDAMRSSWYERAAALDAREVAS